MPAPARQCSVKGWSDVRGRESFWTVYPYAYSLLSFVKYYDFVAGPDFKILSRGLTPPPGTAKNLQDVSGMSCQISCSPCGFFTALEATSKIIVSRFRKS